MVGCLPVSVMNKSHCSSPIREEHIDLQDDTDLHRLEACIMSHEFGHDHLLVSYDSYLS